MSKRTYNQNSAAAVLRMAKSAGGGQQIVDQSSTVGPPQFDQVYQNRPFYTELGVPSKDNRPIVPTVKSEAAAARIAQNSRVLVQSFVTGQWRAAAHSDDPRRALPMPQSQQQQQKQTAKGAIEGAVVPNARFPSELSNMGAPLKRPKIKLTVAHIDTKQYRQMQQRRRQRDDDDKAGPRGPNGPNSKKGGGKDGGGEDDAKGGGAGGGAASDTSSLGGASTSDDDDDDYSNGLDSDGDNESYDGDNELAM